MAAKVLILAASLGALMTVPTLAHHSFGSEYDEKAAEVRKRSGDQAGMDQSARPFLRGCEGCQREGD